MACSLWRLGNFWTALLLTLSVLFYFDVFLSVAHVTNMARHVKTLSQQGLPASSANGSPPSSDPKASLAAKMLENNVDLADRCVMFSWICVLTWTTLVLIYFGGVLRLYSVVVEEVAFSILDVASKAMYASSLGYSHVKFGYNSEMFTAHLLYIERKATMQRRRFLRYVMHEVRVPLNTVHLGIETIALKVAEDLVKQEEEEEYALSTLIKQTQLGISTMSATLDDALSFAAIEEGRFDLQTAAFEVVAVLSQAFKAFEAAAADKGVKLVVTANSDIPSWLIGDGRRLSSVVQNFASNAIKFSPAGSTTTLKIVANRSRARA